MQTTTPWYQDSALLAVFLAPLFNIINSKFGLSLNATEILGLVLPIVAYIIGHKWHVTQVAVANANAAGSKAAALAEAKAADTTAAAVLAGAGK